MECSQPTILSGSFDPWGRQLGPHSAVDLECSPLNVFSSTHLSIYVDQNKLHHPSMKPWTPATSTDLSEDPLHTEIGSIPSQVLERIGPIESESFESAEEMFKIRDEQSSARQYSLRQTYSFLDEISSSGAQNSPPIWISPGKERFPSLPLRKTSTPSHDMWSPATKQTSAKYTRSSSGHSTSEDARKASLNKNKLAAAKCRVNKNVQTEKLRESAHAVVAANNRLRQEVMNKMEEIQALHTEVLCHAVDNGCRDPHALRQFLCVDQGCDVMRSDPTPSEESHAPTAETSSTLDAKEHPIPGASLSRRRSTAPSPPCGINRFKHGSIAHQRAERKLRTQLSEP